MCILLMFISHAKCISLKEASRQTRMPHSCHQNCETPNKLMNFYYILIRSDFSFAALRHCRRVTSRWLRVYPRPFFLCFLYPVSWRAFLCCRFLIRANLSGMHRHQRQGYQINESLDTAKELEHEEKQTLSLSMSLQSVPPEVQNPKSAGRNVI